MSEKKKVKNSHGGVSSSPGGRSLAGTSPMDVRLLEEIVKLMAANGLSSVELSDGERRIALRRGPEPGSMSAAPMAAYSPAPAPSAPAASPAPVADDESSLVPIKSPMPGTFYSAPAKGSKPFVAVGSKVDEETDVCIVEAMKVFNTLKAETRGTVARVLVQDSQPVEFGQVLFLVKPG